MTRSNGPADTRGTLSPEDETHPGDLDSARDSIRSHLGTSGNPETSQPARGLAKYKDSFLLASTVITMAVAIGGLLFTIFQFDKTMKAQRYATAEATVGQFIAQVTELRTQEILSRSESGSGNLDSGHKSSGCTNADTGTQDASQLDSFIISRAQMLIDGEETGQFAGDILRFLTANKYGHYIGRKPCPPGQQQKAGPRMSLEGLVLVNSKIIHADMNEVFLKCMGFDQGVFDSVTLTNGNFQQIVLTKSELHGVDFSGSWLGSIDFSDTTITGKTKFDNAILFGINFKEADISSASFSFDGARVLHSDLSDFKAENGKTEEIVAVFRKAESLWKTTLDPSIMEALKESMSTEEYKKLVENAPGKYEGIKPPMLDWSWDEHCPPQQRRDRRFDLAPGDSLGMVKALF
ncbi:MAG: pentapeptide repeat-containing protein [Granulosicoccus sp.]